MLSSKAVLVIFAVVIIIVIGVVGIRIVHHDAPIVTAKKVLAQPTSPDDAQFYSGKVDNSGAKGY